MCGISGWYAFSDKRPSVETIKGLLLAQMMRGTDATGIAYQEDAGRGAIRIVKEPVKASDFIELLEKQGLFEQIVASPRGLIHARAQTKGPAKDNENNHPVLGFGWAAVHNGHVSNDDDLYRYYKERNRFAQVDTSAIPLVLGVGKDYYSSLSNLSILRGDVTTAVWQMDDPERIAIARLGRNDVYLFYDMFRKIMYWSSSAAGRRAVPTVGLDMLRFSTNTALDDERVLVLNPKANSTEVYELKRNAYSIPYFHQPRVSGNTTHGATNVHALPAATSTSVVETATGAVPSSEAFARREYTWERHKDEQWVRKPSPKDRPDEMAAMTFDTFDKGLIVRKFMNNEKLLAVPIDTGYGRWLARKSDVGIVYDFFPRKAMKKSFRVRFKKLGGLLASLPVSMEHAEQFSKKAILENFNIQTYNNPMSYTQSLGYMCPYCGIVHSVREWAKNEYRCDWCRIKSRTYFEKGE